MKSDTTPATFGGPGWRSRLSSHPQEIAEGKIWHRCGCNSEVTDLREVLLCLPGKELRMQGSADDNLMLAPVDWDKLREEILSLRSFYESQEIRVRLYRPPRKPPPNLIFLRDLFLMTPEGAILARPASQQRQGEERFAAEALAAIGIPILTSFRGHCHFEGADVLWLSRDTALAGIGRRTNRAAFKEVSRLLREMGTQLLPIPLPDQGYQHLLGAVNFIDHDLAAVRGDSPAELKQILDENDITSIELPPDEELLQRRGMNFVTLAPRRVVMPAACPGIRRRLEQVGVDTFEVPLPECLKAGGGMACLTGIICRSSSGKNEGC